MTGPTTASRGPRGLLSGAYDRLYTADRLRAFRHATVFLALGGLVVHVLLILLARTLESPPPVVALVGRNFLSALYTPFSFVLFYEVLLLVLAIPESITSSLGKQYEILSLIVIRSVFKDIAEFESLTSFEGELEAFAAVLLDMGGGLVMFVLVAAFYHANHKRPERPDPTPGERARIGAFVEQKKAIAFVLSVLLFVLAIANLGSWTAEVIGVARETAVPTIDVEKIFYVDLFTVMIFADAIILIVSLRMHDRYELVFRNAAFVGATILLRFSLAVKKPYDVELGIASIAFGTLVVLIYNYYLRIQHGPQKDRAESLENAA